MKILYISYWNINDPLTVATVYPNLKVLANFDWIDQIVFVNIEREGGIKKLDRSSWRLQAIVMR